MRPVRHAGAAAIAAALVVAATPSAATASVGLPCSYTEPGTRQGVVSAGPIQSDTIALATYVACWFQTVPEPYAGPAVAGPWEFTVFGPVGVLPPTPAKRPAGTVYLCTEVVAINFAPYPTYVACAPAG